MQYLEIDAAYLAAKMKEHHLTQKAAAAALCGGTDRILRKWLAGETISNPAKAAIFYYFKALEAGIL